jgi:hypothetical protein
MFPSYAETWHFRHCPPRCHRGFRLTTGAQERPQQTPFQASFGVDFNIRHQVVSGGFSEFWRVLGGAVGLFLLVVADPFCRSVANDDRPMPRCG